MTGYEVRNEWAVPVRSAGRPAVLRVLQQLGDAEVRQQTVAVVFEQDVLWDGERDTVVRMCNNAEAGAHAHARTYAPGLTSRCRMAAAWQAPTARMTCAM